MDKPIPGTTERRKRAESNMSHRASRAASIVKPGGASTARGGTNARSVPFVPHPRIAQSIKGLAAAAGSGHSTPTRRSETGSEAPTLAGAAGTPRGLPFQAKLLDGDPKPPTLARRSSVLEPSGSGTPRQLPQPKSRLRGPAAKPEPGEFLTAKSIVRRTQAIFHEDDADEDAATTVVGDAGASRGSNAGDEAQGAGPEPHQEPEESRDLLRPMVRIRSLKRQPTESGDSIVESTTSILPPIARSQTTAASEAVVKPRPALKSAMASAKEDARPRGVSFARAGSLRPAGRLAPLDRAAPAPAPAKPKRGRGVSFAEHVVRETKAGPEKKLDSVLSAGSMIKFLQQNKTEAIKAKEKVVSDDAPAIDATRSETLASLQNMSKVAREIATAEAAAAARVVPRPAALASRKEYGVLGRVATGLTSLVKLGEGRGRYDEKGAYFAVGTKHRAYLADVRGLARLWARASKKVGAYDGSVTRTVLADVAVWSDSRELGMHSPNLIKSTIAHLTGRASMSTLTLRELLAGAFPFATAADLTLLHCECIGASLGPEEYLGIDDEVFQALSNFMVALEQAHGRSGQGVPTDLLGNLVIVIHDVESDSEQRFIKQRMSSLKARRLGALDIVGMADWWRTVNFHTGFPLDLELVKTLGDLQSSELAEILQEVEGRFARDAREPSAKSRKRGQSTYAFAEQQAAELEATIRGGLQSVRPN